MRSASSAELRLPIAYPKEIDQPIWQERRTFPVTAVYEVASAFLAVLTFAVRPLALEALFGVAAVVSLLLLIRGWRRALIETYSVSERFVAIVQPGRGRVAIPTETLTRVTLAGDSVRLESSGVPTLGSSGDSARCFGAWSASRRRSASSATWLRRAGPARSATDEIGRLRPPVAPTRRDAAGRRRG